MYLSGYIYIWKNEFVWDIFYRGGEIFQLKCPTSVVYFLMSVRFCLADCRICFLLVLVEARSLKLQIFTRIFAFFFVRIFVFLFSVLQLAPLIYLNSYSTCLILVLSLIFSAVENWSFVFNAVCTGILFWCQAPKCFDLNSHLGSAPYVDYFFPLIQPSIHPSSTHMSGIVFGRGWSS